MIARGGSPCLERQPGSLATHQSPIAGIWKSRACGLPILLSITLAAPRRPSSNRCGQLLPWTAGLVAPRLLCKSHHPLCIDRVHKAFCQDPRGLGGQQRSLPFKINSARRCRNVATRIGAQTGQTGAKPSRGLAPAAFATQPRWPKATRPQPRSALPRSPADSFWRRPARQYGSSAPCAAPVPCFPAACSASE